MLNRIVIILNVILLLAAFLVVPVNGLNIRIDGAATEKVWLDCRTQVLVSNRDESNNDVDFAIASVLCDEGDNRVYLSFKVNVNGTVLPPEQSTAQPVQYMYGVRINVDNSGFVGAYHNSVEPYDDNLYYIEAAVSQLDRSAFSAEICLGVKLGLDTLKSIYVQFVDGNGVPSNIYEVDLPALPSEETTTSSFQPAFDETEKETTSKNNTTRITTTRRTTTERTTKPAKTTVEKTTVEKTTAVKTTKEKTTKLKTTKPKTTAKVVTVYVTVPQELETTVKEATVSEAASEQIQQEKTYKELKYAAAAGLLILIFGLCVIINMLNDKNGSKK